MKLTQVISVWEILHTADVGELGYCDLEKAVAEVVGIENDISPCQPSVDEIPTLLASEDEIPKDITALRKEVDTCLRSTLSQTILLERSISLSKEILGHCYITILQMQRILPALKLLEEKEPVHI